MDGILRPCPPIPQGRVSMTSNPGQRLSPFQTQQLHAVEMQPGRHKQVSCGPPAFSPSYQGFRMRVVLHRPEAFVSSCRTSLSSRVTCVATEPSQCPGPGNLRLCGRPFACSHKATCARWPDFHGNRTPLPPVVEAHVPSLVFPRSRTYCSNQISEPSKRNSSQ